MNDKPKLVGSAPARGSLYKVCIVGASSLKGRELKEALEDHSFPAIDIKLLDDDEALGKVESVNDEATFVQAVSRDQFDGMDIAFFSCDPAFAAKTWRMAKDAGCSIVDISYGIDPAAAEFPVRAPWLERELGAGEPRPNLENTVFTAAHPAATVLALIFSRLQKLGELRAATATIFEPVSEQGKSGMDELHQQTLNLLSFHPLPKAVFDMQVAFNLVDRYGEASKASLAGTEALLTRHFLEITASRLPLPALQLIQAPTFHGYIFSIYVEPISERSQADVAATLEGEHMELIAAEEDGPSNIGAAGQENVSISIRPDMNRKGFWIWAAADNLKITALTAYECALALAAGRPSDKIQ